LPPTEDIFQLHINHGQNVVDGQYAYVVYGGEEKAQKVFSDMPLTILENTIDIQAISWGDAYIGASFYNPEKVLEVEDSEISVSTPCALLLEKINGTWKLTVTDAQMDKNLKTIEVKTSLPISGGEVSKDGKWNVVSVPMPQGALCGKPATVELTMEN
jgi:chondroitin AC lyase